MAILRPGRMGRKRLQLKPAVMFRVSQGRTYAQAWPRKRGRPAYGYQRAELQRMATSQRMVARLPENEVSTMEQGLIRFLTRHTGVKGTAAIRLRDWLTQIFYGRAWAISEPDGTVHYSAAVYRDCSDFLDWLEPMTGSMVTRTDEAWLPTFQCRKGNVFSVTHDWHWNGACRNASIPPARLALGGTYEETGVGSVLEPPDTIPKSEVVDVPQDLFDRNPFADYSRDGDLATLWMIDGGYMRSALGDNGHLIRNGVSIQDGYVEADCDQAYNSGLLARYQDASNHYLFAFGDDSGQLPNSNLIVYEVVAGGFNRIIDVNISWTRGVSHTFRLEFTGDTFTVYVDGAQQAQAISAAITGAGGVGMRNWRGDGVNRLSRFAWDST